MQFTLTAAPASGLGNPIILLPGLFAGAWIWERAAEVLTDSGCRNVRVVNESFAVADCLRSGQVEVATDFVMNSLKSDGDREKVVLCGNSFGGVVALDAAARYPDRVAAIVVSGAPGLTPEVSFGLPQRADLDFAYGAVARLFHDQSRVPLGRVEETFKILVRPGPLRNVVKGLKASRTYDVRGAMAKFQCPALFVWGEFDEVSPVQPWIEPVGALPNARLEIIADSGHSPMLEQPEAFSKCVSAFLAASFPPTADSFTAALASSAMPSESSSGSHKLGSWAAVDEAPAYRQLNERLVKRIPIAPNSKVIDLGCGSGGVSRALLDRVPGVRVCAVDTSQAMLDSIPLGTRSRIECLCARAEELDQHVPGGFADGVLLANCVHLFDDFRLAFHASYCSLSVGGWIALSTTFFEGGRNRANARFERELMFTAASTLMKRMPNARLSRQREALANWLDSGEIKAALQQAGFEDLQCEVFEARLDVEALTELMGSVHFAGALFPGVSPELAAEVLRESAIQVLEKNGLSELKRNWLFIAGRKEDSFAG